MVQHQQRSRLAHRQGRARRPTHLPFYAAYPHVSCAGGELLVADNPPIENGYQGPLPTFRSVISIPPVVNRLVLFSPGILHRINPFEGERYSVAVNIWEQAPLTTTAAEPPA